MIDKTLYGKDKKGGFKTWRVYTLPVFGGDYGTDGAKLVIEHGKEGGKLTKKEEDFDSGKQGRNALQQADFEAESRINEQLQSQYRFTKEELENLDILAMLAADYTKQGHRVEYPCYGSVKYDGVRALAKKRNGVVTLESRKSLLFNLPHLIEILTIHMEDGDIWDGEIYKHGEELQDILSAIKRTDTQTAIDKAVKKTEKARYATPYDEAKHKEVSAELAEAVHIHELRPQLQFHIFDVVSDKKFVDRVKDLDSLCGIPVVSPHIQITEYFYIADEEDMKTKHKVAVGLGYEGIMLRNFKGLYESGKRSADLQKYKTFFDSEFLILDVVPNKDDGSAYLVKNDLNELTFTVTLGSMSDRAKALENKELYKQKSITVKYQTRYKGTLLPQFPTGVAIRDYE
uniref:DNA ligase n=2 Tax=unclassified bacterial viruses TaxID=12333 RepID=A0AAU6VZP9_9VIRU